MLEIIVATGKNREIGKENKLLWHLPEDLKHFKNLTKNSTVIMGYNTYLSIGRPLPNRKNIVICDKDIEIEGVIIYNDLKKCLSENTDAYIIGGQSIYEQTLDYVSELHISYIDKTYEDADTYFPEYEDKFKLKYSEKKTGFEYRVYEKME